MAKPKKTPGSTVKVAGFSPAEWKKHMNADEDWTERLEGASEAVVLEVIAALEHTDAEVRALSCNLAYALGVPGLGTHAPDAVAGLAALANGDKKAKVRNRARIVHESLAGEVERAAMRRELPWLAAYAEDALPQAVAAIDDARDAVRLQVYLWWANAAAIPAPTRTTVQGKLAARIELETDEVIRRAAQIAHAHVGGG